MPAQLPGQRRAVFLDRDGTLNVERHHLFRREDWAWVEGAVEGIRQINRLGWLAIIVTNQSGIARGLYEEADVLALHRHVDKLLAAAGAKIDAYYLCSHHPDYGAVRDCDCRKPMPGMLLRAAQDFSIDLAGSYLVGDKASDIGAGKRAGVTPILVATGHGMSENASVCGDVLRSANLASAMAAIQRGLD